MNKSALFHRRHPALVKISEYQRRSLLEHRLVKSERIEYVHTRIEGDLVQPPSRPYRAKRSAVPVSLGNAYIKEDGSKRNESRSTRYGDSELDRFSPAYSQDSCNSKQTSKYSGSESTRTDYRKYFRTKSREDLRSVNSAKLYLESDLIPVPSSQVYPNAVPPMYKRYGSAGCYYDVPLKASARRARSLNDLLSDDDEWIEPSTPSYSSHSASSQDVPQQSPSTVRSNTNNPSPDTRRPRFIAVNSLEDAQAVRCAEFHPDGKLYAVGSNSKTLRICAYPDLSELSEDHITRPPSVLFKRTKHHKGSIYCLGWNPAGDLIATGSNDKTVKLMRFSSDNCSMEGPEIELTMHDGTVRDVCFIEDSMNKSSLLISGGGGDCKVYVTDCATGTPFQALSGHTATILSLYTWGGAMFASGSQDKTVRFWDLRTGGCVSLITPVTNNSSVSKGSSVASTCVDPSGRLLVTGHEDGACVFYDIRGSRHVQMCKPHSSDVRSVRFSPSAYYLLTAGYDGKLILTDLQGDLTRPLPSVSVAHHNDKAISARWHSSEFSFVSTSADKTCSLWALPPV